MTASRLVNMAEGAADDVEYRGHASFAAHRRHLYVDRSGLLAQLDGFARQEAGPARMESRAVVVSGPSGSGKSSLLARWTERYRTAHPDAFLFEHYVGSTSGSVDHVELIRRVMQAIRTRYDLTEEIPATRMKIEEDFLLWLARVQSEQMVIVLDALDQLDADGRGLAWLPEYLQPQLRLVVSAADGEVLEKVRAYGWSEVRIDPLTRSDRMEIVRRHLGAERRGLSREQLERVASSGAGANPLFLRTSLDEIRRFRSGEKLDERIDYFLGASGLENLFSRVLERFESEHGEEIVRDVLSLLWASRRGLTTGEIGQLTHRTPAALTPIFRSLEMHLLKNDDVLSFSHEYLRSAVRNHYVSDTNVGIERRLRRRLIRLFESAPATRRTAEELPWQLQRTGATDGLRAAILRPDLFPILASDDNRLQLLRYWSKLRSERDGLASELRSMAIAHAEEVGSESLDLLEKAGRYLHDLGEYSDARELLQRALGLRRTIGGDRAGLARTLIHLGELDTSAENHEAADEELSEGIASLRECGTATSLELAEAQLLLATLDYRRHAFKSAAVRCEELLRQLDDDRDGCSPVLPRALGLAGAVQYGLRDFDAAEVLLQRALREAEHVYGPEHPETINCLNNVGAGLAARQDWEAALPYFERTSAALASILGPNHPEVARTLLNIGVALRREGAFERAVEANERALEILRSRFGPASLSVADAHSYLTTALICAGEFDRAEEESKEALRIYEAQLGDSDYRTMESRLDLADLWIKRGLTADAFSVYKSELPKMIALLGEFDTRLTPRIGQYRWLVEQMHRSPARDPILRTLKPVEQSAS